MKVRTGFVSNSSSQSFIIRGIEINKKTLAKLWGITKEDIVASAKDNNSIEDEKELVQSNLDRALMDELSDNKYKLDVSDVSNVFDNDCSSDTCLVGEELDKNGDWEDGEIFKIPRPSHEQDINLVEKLKKANIETTEDKLDTYVRYVSNDNF